MHMAEYRHISEDNQAPEHFIRREIACASRAGFKCSSARRHASFQIFIEGNWHISGLKCLKMHKLLKRFSVFICRRVLRLDSK
jgi:hypothetical protein